MIPAEVTKKREDDDRARKLKTEQFGLDIKWLMSHAQGRRLMWAWLSEFGLYRTPYTGENNRTNFNLGVHNSALILQAQVLEHAPESMALMTQEAQVPATRAPRRTLKTANPA